MASSRAMIYLDIGTTKISVIIARASDTDFGHEILAWSTVACAGLSRGMIVDMEATVQAILSAVKEVRSQTDVKTKDVIVGISGSHINSLHSNGIVPIVNQEVQQMDVDRVIEAAKAVAIPSNQTILHVLPQEFVVDDQVGVEKPIGMSGVRLEARVLIVTCAESALQNIVKCVERCGLRVEQVILEQLASSLSTISKAERDLGVCVLDLGGGTTDLAVFSQGQIRHVSVIPVAGDHVTNDIAMALRTPPNFAEDIKIKHGVVSKKLLDEELFIEVANLSDSPVRTLPIKSLYGVVEARYQELFCFVLSKLKRKQLLGAITSGIVLTGGASKMPGVVDLASDIFKTSVRVSEPLLPDGPEELKDPRYATVVGLLLQADKSRATMLSGNLKGFRGVFRKVKYWLECNL